MADSPSLFTRWNQALAQAVEQLDTPESLESLIKAIRGVVDIGAVLLVVEKRGKAPVLLFESGVPDSHRRLYIDEYFAGIYLLDPFCMAVEDGLEPGFYHLADIAPDDFRQSDFYRVYYREGPTGR